MNRAAAVPDAIAASMVFLARAVKGMMFISVGAAGREPKPPPAQAS
jgi:hypothetical protein